MYIYIYMYIHICTCIFIHTCILVHECVYFEECMRTLMCISVSVFCIYIHAGIYTCIHNGTFTLPATRQGNRQGHMSAWPSRDIRHHPKRVYSDKSSNPWPRKQHACVCVWRASSTQLITAAAT